MTAAATLARLRALGVTAEVHGDRLTLRPASAIPPDLLAEVRANKAEVLALLAAKAAAPPSASAVGEAPDAWGLTAADRAAAMARLRAPTLPPASAEQAADEAADRDAVAAEPLLPDPGTPERERMDRQHAAMVAGLLTGFSRSRSGLP